MTFDFKAYQQQALTTALPSALTMDYLAPGLIAELGEVFGKQAKAVRDGWDEDRLNREVCAELGDCLWFLALIAHMSDVAPWPLQIDPFSPRSLDGAMLIASTLLSGGKSDAPLVTQLLKILTFQAEAHGSTLEAVAQANLDKLADRQARGTITGSGDTR